MRRDWLVVPASQGQNMEREGPRPLYLRSASGWLLVTYWIRQPPQAPATGAAPGSSPSSEDVDSCVRDTVFSVLDVDAGFRVLARRSVVCTPPFWSLYCLPLGAAAPPVRPEHRRDSEASDPGDLNARRGFRVLLDSGHILRLSRSGISHGPIPGVQPCGTTTVYSLAGCTVVMQDSYESPCLLRSAVSGEVLCNWDELRDHEPPITVCSRDGKWLAFPALYAGDNGDPLDSRNWHVRICDSRDPSVQRVVRTEPPASFTLRIRERIKTTRFPGVRELALNSDGSLVGVHDQHGNVEVWNVAQNRMVRCWRQSGRPELLDGLQFTQDNTLIWTDQSLGFMIWPTSAEEPVAVHVDPPHGMYGYSVDSAARRAAVLVKDKHKQDAREEVLIVDVAQRAVVLSLPVPTEPGPHCRDVLLRADGQQLVVSHSGGLQVWDLSFL